MFSSVPGRGLGDRVRRRKRLASLRKLYTHPQAWGQCDAFLSGKLKGVERQDVSSTSKAAELVASPHTDEESAAIASRLAAEVNDLEILAENIEDQGDNVTRFFIFARTDTPPEEIQKDINAIAAGETLEQEKKSKSLISFTIDHATPGALAETLEVFKNHNFNLTSIDTRPSRIRPWHYIFFVECERASHGGTNGDGEDEKQIEAMLEDLGKIALSHRFWGRWEDRLGDPMNGQLAI